MTSISAVVSPHKIGVLQQTNSREIIILRKPILPKEDILITNNSRNKPKSKGKECKTQPQPIAVARRNARERNRVKQVNNGFANLRQHIPNFIAAAFESNSRGGNKKLSKVETLRMAVEYIRSLEDLLNFEHTSEPEGNSSMSSFSSPSPSGFHHEHDDLSANSTPPQQYSYQILSYEDNENLEPLNVEDHILSDPALMDAGLEFKGVQDLSLLNMHPSDSLSPGMYSEQSLSPGGSDQRVFFGEDVKSDEVPVISLKTENELSQQHKSNVLDVMQWWDQQQAKPMIS